LHEAGISIEGLRSKSWDELGYPDPSSAEGGDEGKHRAFELTRQAIAYRMLQLLQLPIASMGRSELTAALQNISRS